MKRFVDYTSGKMMYTTKNGSIPFDMAIANEDDKSFQLSVVRMLNEQAKAIEQGQKKQEDTMKDIYGVGGIIEQVSALEGIVTTNCKAYDKFINTQQDRIKELERQVAGLQENKQWVRVVLKKLTSKSSR